MNVRAWFEQHYERVIFGAGMSTTVVIVLMVARAHLAFEAGFQESARCPDDDAIGIESSDLALAVHRLDEPIVWSGEHLFVSAPMWEARGSGKLFAGCEIESHGPISYQWIETHFDVSVVADLLFASRDPDADRFTNLEEFLSGTNPVESASVPPRVIKLCLARMVSPGISLIYRGQVDPKTWHIHVRSPGMERTEDCLLSMGKKFGPEEAFRFESAESRRVLNAHGAPVDQSVLLVSYQKVDNLGRSQVRLVVNQPWEMPAEEGVIRDRYDGAEYQTQVGGLVAIGDDLVFTLEEWRPPGAVLRDQGGRRHVIPGCE